MLGLFCFMMMWWYDDHHMITWWSSYNNLTIIIWRTDQHIIFDNHESPTFRKYSICLILIALWWYDDHHKIIWWSSYEDMMTLTCCQDHILTENIWFVWSKTSYSGDERRCHGCGTTERRTTISEDRATQPMETGGWVSQKVTKNHLVKMLERPIPSPARAIWFSPTPNSEAIPSPSLAKLEESSCHFYKTLLAREWDIWELLTEVNKLENRYGLRVDLIEMIEMPLCLVR